MSSFVQFWYVCMSGICLTSVTKSFGSIFEIFTKNKNRWHLWRKISENDPAYQFLQITTSVNLYFKVYFFAISVVKVVRNFEWLPSDVFVWSKNRADIRDGNEYKIRKWLVFKFYGSGHLQIILHLNKITECLKMTTFKIVYFWWVFLVLKQHALLMFCTVI